MSSNGNRAIAVAAVVSSFNPGPELIRNVQALMEQVDRVTVVDDGSTRDIAAVLDGLKATGAGVVRLERNSGIAAALNAGIRAELTEGDVAWIMTMDQDSRLGPDYVERALKTAASSKSPDSVGMVSAESHNGARVKGYAGTDPDEPEVFDPMQSGSLVRAAAIHRAGLLDEDLFIDCVDSEFNARLRSHGYRLLAGQGCDLLHSLGESRPMRILGWHATIGPKKLSIYYHAPFRVYYISRNILVLAKRYVRTQPRWVAQRLFLEVESHVIRFIYGPRRRKHLVAFLSGTRDGILNRLGRIGPELEKRLR
ncbi:glycosyltransferase [Arthrobacter sp. Sa2CUA1]|uniref:Glycosyltransferase n=1 Tax=Arthrobacter gallicola TaxID=2762225 RepID=A0ABR8US56_9MICC|nr:glycosyltransferase [Arthrobacter gallicola]MBD7995395.1 glycosyltransferase [Arthrobacter gallicola]